MLNELAFKHGKKTKTHQNHSRPPTPHNYHHPSPLLPHQMSAPETALKLHVHAAHPGVALERRDGEVAASVFSQLQHSGHVHVEQSHFEGSASVSEKGTVCKRTCGHKAKAMWLKYICIYMDRNVTYYPRLKVTLCHENSDSFYLVLP